MSDSINIGTMHSYRDWEAFARRRGWEWFQPELQPEWLAWLVAVLKQSEDMPELFPHGKWASIQQLETKLAVSAAQERITERERRECAGPKP